MAFLPPSLLQGGVGGGSLLSSLSRRGKRRAPTPGPSLKQGGEQEGRVDIPAPLPDTRRNDGDPDE